jgi:hypothetical protein
MNVQNPYCTKFVGMSNEVIPYLQRLPLPDQGLFLQKLEAQLAKDLYPVEWGETTATPTPDGIVARLHSAVMSLIEEHNSSLGQVLYRIDIAEGKIKSLMSATHSSERASVLANEILEREAKKVWLRMHFSQNA